MAEQGTLHFGNMAVEGLHLHKNILTSGRAVFTSVLGGTDCLCCFQTTAGLTPHK